MTLVTFTQVDSSIVTADVGEIVSAPVRIRETQDIYVESTLRARSATFKIGSARSNRVRFIGPFSCACPLQIKASVPCRGDWFLYTG